MNKRNILIITPFFFPERISSGRYNTILASELARCGCAVTVICSHPLYPTWNPHRTTEALHNITAVRAGAWVRYPKGNVLKRVVLESWFAIHAIISTFRLRGVAKSVIIVFPPVMFAPVIRSLLPKAVPIVGIVHDLQGIMAKTKSGTVRKAVSKTISIIERRAFQSCTSIIALSEGMRGAIIDDYKIDAEIVSVIYPFAQLGTVATKEPLGIFDQTCRNVVYAGALGEKQMPELLLSVMEEVVSLRPNVRCYVFSEGPAFKELKARAKRTDRISFHSLVKEKELASLYAGSTVQIIPQAPETGAGAFPSKLPNLVVTGTPLFAVCEHNSELDELVKRLSCARTSYEKTAQLIAKDLLSFLNDVAEMSHTKCAEGNQTVLQELFSVQCLMDKLHSTLERPPC